MLKVQIVLFDGFDLLDAIAPYEVFHAAATHTDNALSVEFVTAEGPRLVPSGIDGLKIEARGRLNPAHAGIILVPGAAGAVEGDGPDSIPTILGRAMNTELTVMMKQALGQKDIVVATVCGGSLLLAMGGLLEGRSAVTHHMGMDVFGATGAIPVSARVVDDGNLVSGGGVTSGLDVALYLVERELGPRIAHAVEQLFEFERRGTATQGDETVALINPVLQDNMLSWSLRITKPMRLNLKFEVAANSDDMTGIAKAGILPASKLTGKRVS
ncbi:DJ-1/PfpI family protein [Paenibacillus jiagnxiensis]|uniref:DJ-1/PfpI family protein n=1 Tax=Paenibacillus jiagnxiensis TaxID=3228926 RepID=UPI0033B2EDE1